MALSIKLEDPESGEEFEVVEQQDMPEDRKARYANGVGEYAKKIASCKKCLAVIGKGKDSGTQKEFVVVEDESGSQECVTGMCGITAEDVSPSEFVEFQFEEPFSDWKIADCTKDALEYYKASKFKVWRERLDNPTCEAEFRRMLQNGLVYKMYDRVLFPTPEGLIEKYEVTDDSGKKLSLPHPVSGLRVYNATTKSYDAIDPRLEGAPGAGEEEKYWEQTLNEFREKQGAGYIDGLLGKK